MEVKGHIEKSQRRGRRPGNEASSYARGHSYAQSMPALCESIRSILHGWKQGEQREHLEQKEQGKRGKTGNRGNIRNRENMGNTGNRGDTGNKGNIGYRVNMVYIFVE